MEPQPEQEKSLTLIEEPIRQRLARIARGLHAPRGSGERRYAVYALSRVFGPSAISIILTLLVVIVMVTFVATQGLSESREVEVTVLDVKTVDLDKIKEEIERIEEPLDLPEMEVAIPQQTPDDFSAPSDTPGPVVQDATIAAVAPVMTKSPLVLRGLFGNRGSTGSRAGALRAYGGSGAGEDAVLRALRWLKAHQGPDGSWAQEDSTHPPAMAGLALLAFLAHGETPASQEFGQTVEKAIKYLLSLQRPDGMFADGGRAYAHGIDTYAICEAYALTRILMLREAMDKAVRVIVDGQQPQGGYNYSYAKDDRFDMSVSGWQFQAFKAAKLAGCSNERLDSAVELGIDFLKHQAFAPAGDRAGFVYSGKPGVQATGGASWTMTGAGTLCLQLLGHGQSPEVKAGLKFLETLPCEWPKAQTSAETAAYEAAKKAADQAAAVAKATTGAAKEAADKRAEELAAAARQRGPTKVPVYGWYYVTQAKFQKGGADWDAWNRMFAKELVQNQQRDGHWEGGEHGGTVYTTTLCCLMLEVYYRYLPTYKKVEDTTPVEATSDDDVVVDVTG